MAKAFHLTIAKIAENLFDGEVQSVTLPGVDGVFQVLANHEALISELKQGTVHIKTMDEQVHDIALTGGIAEISQNQVTIIA